MTMMLIIDLRILRYNHVFLIVEKVRKYRHWSWVFGMIVIVVVVVVVVVFGAFCEDDPSPSPFRSQHIVCPFSTASLSPSILFQ